MKTLLEKIKNKIDKSDIISFDVFDTLLVRPYLKPEDLFKHISLIYNDKSFYLKRIEAYNKAYGKRKNKDDITFDDIYNEIDKNYKKYKNIELNQEIQTLSPNPEMKEVYDYVKKQNKRIIIISDMYLDKSIIKHILNKNGYKGFSNLFVSGNIGKMKYTGNLYEYIIKKTKLKPFQIIHIGDNKHSDYKMSRKYGFKSIPYKKLTEQIIDNNKKIKDLFNISDLSIGIFISIFSKYIKKENNNWAKLGYFYLGYISYAFYEYINTKIKNKANLLFVSQNTYTLYKVFKLINKSNNIKIYYINSKENINNCINKLNKNNLIIIDTEFDNKYTKLKNKFNIQIDDYYLYTKDSKLTDKSFLYIEDNKYINCIKSIFSESKYNKLIEQGLNDFLNDLKNIFNNQKIYASSNETKKIFENYFKYFYKNNNKMN